MKKQFMVIIVLGIVITFFSGCATFPQTDVPAQKSNLSVGMVKKVIKKGETTQAEILEWFGSPNLVTKNRSNDEVWNYNRMSFEAKAGADGGSLILWGGSRAMATTTTKSFDLIITFDSNDVVKDYSVIYASY
jgi:outer membrane protein assembly factor BamE (lipoprotein component of BamABCDE complex)